jgi:glycerol transport system ATP-binding protein
VQLTLEKIGLQVGGDTHLVGIDLTLATGSFNILLGPTQAGKTSLMRLMAGLDRPSTGRVLVDGRDVTGVRVRSRDVAMVYQQFVNYPSFTVFENIASPLRIAGRLSAHEIDTKVRAAAAMMHIDHLLDRLPAQLSGGQQQRTAIARALTKQAGLLLLDEPLVNLDYKLREELRMEMRELFSNGATTVVYATTEPVEALLLGGHTAVIDAGRLQQFGPTAEVYHQPANIRVAEVFSDPPINLLASRLDGPWCQVTEGWRFARPTHMRDLPAGEYRLGIRAHHVGVGPESPHSAVLPAEVELAEISGSETFVHARHAGFALVARLEGVHHYRLGQAVTLCFSPDRLFAFDLAGRLVAMPACAGHDGRRVASWR